ncbi:hypothetical protein H9651_13475 [Microbacterium sp. Sa4CUA7]|uniref:DUF1508 domain-containing protein n=1 Tax=Microbacterium pullorum TaxID=2762236 RepID=A0ABR8S5B4_9MICO|nr:hypothetical protein [Microbacterium pullorum]MBD7958650.1 hypothetical protein [Microbacterium pullorum]
MRIAHADGAYTATLATDDGEQTFIHRSGRSSAPLARKVAEVATDRRASLFALAVNCPPVGVPRFTRP